MSGKSSKLRRLLVDAPPPARIGGTLWSRRLTDPRLVLAVTLNAFAIATLRTDELLAAVLGLGVLGLVAAMMWEERRIARGLWSKPRRAADRGLARLNGTEPLALRRRERRRAHLGLAAVCTTLIALVFAMATLRPDLIALAAAANGLGFWAFRASMASIAPPAEAAAETEQELDRAFGDAERAEAEEPVRLRA